MFHGSIVAVVTPMNAKGEIDFDALAKLLHFHLENKTDAIVVCGSTGEAATLSAAEQQEILTFTLNEVKRKIPIIAGTGSNCTQKTIEHTRKAMEIGADACLVVTPYYNKPTQEGLFLHFQALANAVPLPIILYNIPGRTAIDMLPETVVRLSKISNIIGLKESSPKIFERCEFYSKNTGDCLDVYSGDDEFGLEAIRLGAKGVISVVANVAPQLMHDMCEAGLKGNFEIAEKINQILMPLHKKLFVETNPIPVKWALSRMKLIENGIRLPLTPLSENMYATVEQALRDSGIVLS